MQGTLQIVFRDMPPSEALEARIREKVAKLEQFHPNITACRVTIEEAHRHQQKGRHFGVRIEVRVPGHDSIVSRFHHHEDPYVAVRDAIGAVRRRVEETWRETRGEVKVHATPQHGKVARLMAEEGFGFIEASDGREFYFSRENVVHPTFEQLGPGIDVQFFEELAGEGSQARRVSAGRHHF
jgi:ribosome-associated translation inhibitor RaiA/cold shock CspA family protein